MTVAKIRYSYNQITQMCEDLAEIINDMDEAEKPKTIVGLIRGGCIPAVILSHLTKIPCKMLSYSSHQGFGGGENDNQIPGDILEGVMQLFVDDICDSGYTLKEVMEACGEGMGNLSASLIYRDHTKSQFDPDMYATRITDSSWVVFPWE
jgi:hypoxanthine phosphoribosyltransferase